jgi:hypothetical protein
MTSYCLAVLTKSPALVAGPALWLLTFTASLRVRWYSPIVRGVPFALPLGLYFAWDKWAHHLNDTFAAGSTYFATDFHFDDYLARVKDPAVLKRVLWFVVPSYGCNWVLFPALAAGIALAFRPGLRAVSAPMLLWLVMGAGLCAGLERLHWHWYYVFMFMLPLVYFGGVGIAAMFEAVEAYTQTTAFVRWGLWFVTLAFLTTSWAGGPYKMLSEVIGSGSQPVNLSWTSEDGFFGLFVLAIVSLAIAASLPLRIGGGLVGVILAAALWVAMPRAVHDVWQIFLFRSRAAEWRDFDTDWKELRRTVDELSTRRDRFVVDGGNPWFLHLVLRKGFAFYGHDIDSLGLAYFLDHHIRFYVHFPQNNPLPNVFAGRTPIRHAERWEIYCVAPAGC